MKAFGENQIQNFMSFFFYINFFNQLLLTLKKLNEVKYCNNQNLTQLKKFILYFNTGIF